MTPRKRVVIGAAETVRVRYRHDKPEVESERRTARTRNSDRQSGSGAGRQLSSNKRQERERRQRGLRIRRGAVILAAVLALVGIAVLVGTVRTSSMFSLDHVTVEGTRHHNRASILRIANVPRGSGVFGVSPSAIRKRLESDPWIASASVHRDLPHGLAIVVNERVPAAMVDAGGAAIWIASKDGYWLSKRSVQDTGLPTIVDVKELAPVAGQRVAEEQVRNAVRLIAGLKPQLLKQTRVISAPTVEETALYTRTDVEVFIGRAENMAEKSRIVLAILKRHKNAVVYINVRVIDRPTWRGLEVKTQ